MFLRLSSNERTTKKHTVSKKGTAIRRITRPRSIRIALELEGARTRKEKTTSDRTTKITKNTEKMTIVNSGRSRNKLTQNMNRIRDVRTSDSKINKTPNEMTITRRIRKRITISKLKLNIKLHRGLNSALIPKSSTSKKILNILFLGDIKAIRSGGNLNPKKVSKRTKISHKKLITKTSLNKGYILRIITGNDHIINIEKKKSASTRRSVNKQRWIMSTRGETSSCHYRSKALKPGTRGLFEAVKRTSKTTNHPLRNRVPRRRLHINLLTQLTIEKGILNIKLGHRPVTNRSNSKKSTHSGHMSNGSKGLIIVTTMLLLKPTSHKTRFIALKRSIKAGLNLIDPLTRDRTNTGRGRDKILGASALKRSNLLSHGQLPFRMMLSIPIRSRLRGNRKTILTRRVTVGVMAKRTTATLTTSLLVMTLTLRLLVLTLTLTWRSG